MRLSGFGGGVNCGAHSVRVGPKVNREREVVAEMKKKPSKPEELCGCVEGVIDYAGVNLPITRRCDAHEAERKARQREDALAWARMNGEENKLLNSVKEE